MLTDAQWLVLAPLVEACRPAAKVPSPTLRQTMSAMVWRHQNGAKWRAVPDEGPCVWFVRCTDISDRAKLDTFARCIPGNLDRAFSMR